MELLSLIDLSNVHIESTLTFKYTYGLDLSGQHMNPNQLSKTHFSTHNVMFVRLTIKNFLQKIKTPGTVYYTKVHRKERTSLAM